MLEIITIAVGIICTILGFVSGFIIGAWGGAIYHSRNCRWKPTFAVRSGSLVALGKGQRVGKLRIPISSDN